MSSMNKHISDFEPSSQSQEELLSLRWNNHLLAFQNLLAHVKEQRFFSDVSVACSGKLYAVHKLVLSSCSDYFSTILQEIECSQPVIILKDVSCEDFEALLNYMYLGEVNVLHEKLSSLLRAAESLGIKGLAASHVDEVTEQDYSSISNLEENGPADRKSSKVCSSDKILNYSEKKFKCNNNFDDNVKSASTRREDHEEVTTNNECSSNTNKMKRKCLSEEEDIEVLEFIHGSDTQVASEDEESHHWTASHKKLKMSPLAVADIFPNCSIDEDIDEFYDADALEDMPQVCVNIKEEPEVGLQDITPRPPWHASGDHQEDQEQDDPSEAGCEGSLATAISEAMTAHRQQDSGHCLEAEEDMSGSGGAMDDVCEPMHTEVECNISPPDDGDEDQVCLLQLESKHAVIKQHRQNTTQSVSDATHSVSISDAKVLKTKLSSSSRVCSTLVPIECKPTPSVLHTLSGNSLYTYASLPFGVTGGLITPNNGGVLTAQCQADGSGSAGNISALPPGVLYHLPAGSGTNITSVGNTASFSSHVAIVCSYCGKEFAFASDLRRHTRSHTGEKPYECSLCNFRTSQRYNLERHKKIHEPKPITSPIIEI